MYVKGDICMMQLSHMIVCPGVHVCNIVSKAQFMLLVPSLILEYISLYCNINNGIQQSHHINGPENIQYFQYFQNIYSKVY